jgi:hypothetical protein
LDFGLHPGFAQHGKQSFGLGSAERVGRRAAHRRRFFLVILENERAAKLKTTQLFGSSRAVAFGAVWMLLVRG